MAIVTREFKQKTAPYFSGEKPAFATTLLSALIMLNGVEVLEWDPITIQMEVKDDLGVEMPRKVYDKLMALISVLATDTVYKDVSVFDETVNALNGAGIGVERGIPAVEDMAWAVTEIGMNDPEPVSRSTEQPWGRDIAKYGRVVLDDEGMDIAPKILGFVKNRTPEKEGMDDNQLYAGVWGNAQAHADEIDELMEKRAIALIHQLMDLGINFNQKEAAWTSAANEATHADKHGEEFGGVEGYAEAEAHYSDGPDGLISEEEQCRLQPDGSVRCGKKREYEGDVVHVVSDDDKTVTLYKKSGMHEHLAAIGRRQR